jgi:hypothetical protein
VKGRHVDSVPLRWGLLLLCLSGVACQRPLKPDERALKPDERAQVYSWLQCEECVDGELDRVKSLGRENATGSATVDTLSEDLLGGPSAVRRSNMRRQYESSYTDDSVWTVGAGSAPVLERAEYVDHYFDTFVNLYRTRAAIALAKIGGTKARAILDSALSDHVATGGDTLSSDTRLAVLFARDSILDHP